MPWLGQLHPDSIYQSLFRTPGSLFRTTGSRACQPADDSIDELGQHGDDEDLFAHWGGAPRLIGHEVCNSQASIPTITPGNTQSSSRIGYP